MRIHNVLLPLMGEKESKEIGKLKDRKMKEVKDFVVRFFLDIGLIVFIKSSIRDRLSLKRRV